MRYMIFLLTMVVVVSTSSNVVAQVDKEDKGDKEKKEKVLKLRSYEPNTAGWTVDDNDTGYLDFKLSLKYPMFHSGEYENMDSFKGTGLPFPFFAFTGRFSQYLFSRDSSPVIGKRFNPLIFFRYWYIDKNNYLDFGYGHESNGQSVNTEKSYLDLRARLEAKGEDPDIGDDSLSRGWDYLHFSLRRTKEDTIGKMSGYLNLKYFLKSGLLQGDAEEYNDWERSSEGKERREVDGISVIGKYSLTNKEKWLEATGGWMSGFKVAAILTTGYKNIFKNNTFRLEATFIIKDLPVMFWYSDGYMSDLADYHEKVSSFGIAFELRDYIENL